MNLLFVNYGDFTSNSLNHIGAFANALTALGHTCVVAVPDKPETISCIPGPLFVPATYDEVLTGRLGFPDGRPADLVHAWTPRENVREFCVRYLRRNPARLFIHLEDNERFLTESFAGAKAAELALRSDEELAQVLPPNLSHPVRSRSFLRLATGVTFITNRLRELVPGEVPVHRLLPGVDARIYAPRPADPAKRARLGVAEDEQLLVFTGSLTFANLADVRALHVAVRLLNERGAPCRLVRTGLYAPELVRRLAVDLGDRVIDRGFVAKEELGELLSLADVLVQPGAPDVFNDYRLPSKIPEFLWSGRPVVLPNANLAREMQPGYHGLLLENGTPDEIAARCLEVFRDPLLAARLARGAQEFARAHFDLAQNTAGLLAFYEKAAAARPAPVGGDPLFSDDTALARSVAREHTPGDAPAGSPAADIVLRMAAREGTVDALRARVAAKDQELAGAAARLAAEQRTLELAAARERYLASTNADLRNAIEVARRQIGSLIDDTRRLKEELAEARRREAETRAALDQRDDKIQRMTESFSWHATSPLRSLRRKFIDPYKRAKRPDELPLPEADPDLVVRVDDPADWGRLPAKGVVRGWCFARRGTVVGLRLRLGGQAHAVDYGQPRPDVAAGHPGLAGAETSGFAGTFEYEGGRTQAVVEALTDDGRWRVAFAAWAQPADRDARDYTEWIRRYDTLDLNAQVGLRARLELAERKPLISVVVPVYNAPEKWLRRAIESVRAQVYPHWELCLADDASPALHVRHVLEDYARRDERIKVVFRAENGHISAASNSALQLATGDFVALLDHDDEIPPDALAEVVLAHNANPEAEFFYSDQDKIDETGRRFDPYFKPDWDPDLLLGQNYPCHLSVFAAPRLKEIGGFRTGFEGSQDWDLILRFTEDLDARRIVHLSKVLYHWRAIAGSTALVITEKDYPVQAARRALTEALQRRHLTGELQSVKGNYWRIRRALPDPAPRVSIIIPTHNGAGLLRRAVGSVQAKTDYPDYEFVIVDHESDEADARAYLAELQGLGARILPVTGEFNYSAFNNRASRLATGEVLVFLNNDVEVINREWLSEMVSHALRPEIGAVGAMLYYPNDTVQHAGSILGVCGPNGRDGVAGHALKYFPRDSEAQFSRLRLVRTYSAVTAACLAIRRSVFLQVGGFNELDLSVAFNDVDFCLRVRAAGYRNLWTPFAELYHHESASRGAEDTPEKAARFRREVQYMRRMWAPILDNDPAYNRNLTFEHEDFSLAWPPRR